MFGNLASGNGGDATSPARRDGVASAKAKSGRNEDKPRSARRFAADV